MPPPCGSSARISKWVWGLGSVWASALGPARDHCRRSMLTRSSGTIGRSCSPATLSY
jgi:hypothetical protein